MFAEFTIAVSLALLSSVLQSKLATESPITQSITSGSANLLALPLESTAPPLLCSGAADHTPPHSQK